MPLLRDGVPSEVVDDEVRNCAVCAVAVGYWVGNEFAKIDPEAQPPKGNGWRCRKHRTPE